MKKIKKNIDLSYTIILVPQCLQKVLFNIMNDIINYVTNIIVFPIISSLSLEEFNSQTEINMKPLSYMSLPLVSKTRLKNHCLRIINIAVDNNKKEPIEKPHKSILFCNKKNSECILGFMIFDENNDSLKKVINFINNFVEKLFKVKKPIKNKIKHKSIFSVQSNLSRKRIIKNVSSSIVCAKKQNYKDKYKKFTLQYITKTFFSNKISAFKLPFNVVKSALNEQKCSNIQYNLISAVVNHWGQLNSQEIWDQIDEKSVYMIKEKPLKLFHQHENEYWNNVKIYFVQVCELYFRISLEKSFHFIICGPRLTTCFLLTFFHENLIDSSFLNIKRSFFIVNEQTENYKIEHYLTTFIFENAFFHKSTQYVSPIKLSTSMSTSYSMSSKCIALFISFPFKITFDNNPESQRQFSITETHKRISRGKFRKTVEKVKNVERNMLTSKPVLKGYINNINGEGSSCTEQCQRSCLCKLLKKVLEFWFPIDSIRFRIKESFLTILIDSWLLILENDLNKIVRNLPKPDVKFIPNNSSKFRYYINSRNNNSHAYKFSKISQILNRHEDLERLSLVPYSIEHKDSKTQKVSLKEIGYLLNILSFVEDIVMTWNVNLLGFEDVITFLFRILDPLRLVLINLSDQIKNRKLTNICDSCTKDIMSILTLNQSTPFIILSFKTILHKINKFCSYIGHEDLIDARLTFSLYKLYCYYKNNIINHRQIDRKVFSVRFSNYSENFDAILQSSAIERRIKDIAHKSKCLFQVKQKTPSGNEKFVEVYCKSQNKGMMSSPVVNMFIKSLVPSRSHIKCSSTKEEGVTLPSKTMSWEDFKYI